MIVFCVLVACVAHGQLDVTDESVDSAVDSGVGDTPVDNDTDTGTNKPVDSGSPPTDSAVEDSGSPETGDSGMPWTPTAPTIVSVEATDNYPTSFDVALVITVSDPDDDLASAVVQLDGSAVTVTVDWNTTTHTGTLTLDDAIAYSPCDDNGTTLTWHVEITDTHALSSATDASYDVPGVGYNVTAERGSTYDSPDDSLGAIDTRTSICGEAAAPTDIDWIEFDAPSTGTWTFSGSVAVSAGTGNWQIGTWKGGNGIGYDDFDPITTALYSSSLIAGDAYEVSVWSDMDATGTWQVDIQGP